MIDRVRREGHALLSFVVLEPLEQGIAVSEAVHVAAHELGAEGLVRGEGKPVREAQEVRPGALDITLQIDGPRSHCEYRRRRGGPVAADRATHHIGGDQPGQGEKVMPGETLSGIVAVEVEEEGPDRLHVEAGELCKGQCELRIGFLAEHHGAIMIGATAQIGAERLGTGVLDPARAGMGLEGRVFLPLLRDLSRPQRQEVADEHIEVFFPVAFEAAFDGPQVVGVEPFLAFPVERHQDEVADHVGAGEVPAAGVHGLEDPVRVVFALLELEGDDAELAQARAERRDVRAELLDAFLEERAGLHDAR